MGFGPAGSDRGVSSSIHGGGRGFESMKAHGEIWWVLFRPELSKHNCP